MTPSVEVGALERDDVGAAELRGEVRVLAVGLLDPAPARIARDVEDRARARAGPRSAASDGGSSRPSRSTASGSKLAAAPIDCWKHGASEAIRPWRHLLVDDRRDAEPRLLDQVALDRVGGLGDLDGSQVGRAGQAGDLADAVDGQGRPAGPRRARTRGRPRTPRTTRAGRPSRHGVIRASRSATRASIGSDGSRYSGDGRRHQPFTDPAASGRPRCGARR